MASFMALRADMGARESRYGFTRGPIWVNVSGLLWIWNHPGIIFFL